MSPTNSTINDPMIPVPIPEQVPAEKALLNFQALGFGIGILAAMARR